MCLDSGNIYQNSCHKKFLFKNRWGLFYGTERNDGLNYGTECFLKLKLFFFFFFFNLLFFFFLDKTAQIEACSLPLLYKLSVALPAAKQTYPKKDKDRLWALAVYLRMYQVGNLIHA